MARLNSEPFMIKNDLKTCINFEGPVDVGVTGSTRLVTF